ncbi:unnamed protein product [Gongylonema pulchrum]|uniref:Protein-serine/threonine phosphatase n=1 Tax=Gongylonema pulchrum TaxID=637853 RepID=A0A183CY43_9BILA|nr:unnamed protein product [Gongylonema pulchrum]
MDVDAKEINAHGEFLRDPAQCSDHDNSDSGSSTVIREGSAQIDVLSAVDAFYNPAQQFNRDLTIIVLQQFVDDRKEELKNKSSNGQAGSEEPLAKRPKKFDVRNVNFAFCYSLRQMGGSVVCVAFWQ